MRFQLHSGANLIARDFSFFGNATSDPYAVVKIGASTFKSAVVKKTLNPVWKDQIEDFFIFSKRQLLTINCFDQDIGSGDDALGKCAVQVGDIATRGRASMELILEGEEDAGTIDVSIKVFDVVQIKEVGIWKLKSLLTGEGILLLFIPHWMRHPLPQIWQAPMEDATSGFKHHVGMVAVQIEDIRGVPKRFPKEGTYLTVEVEENPKMVYRDGNGVIAMKQMMKIFSKRLQRRCKLNPETISMSSRASPLHKGKALHTSETPFDQRCGLVSQV